MSTTFQHRAFIYADDDRYVAGLAPFIREGVEYGTLNIDGAWFSIGKGELHWRNKGGDFSVVDSGPEGLEPGEGI